MHGRRFTPSAGTVTPLHHVFLCTLYIECTEFTTTVIITGFTNLLQPECGLSAYTFTAICSNPNEGTLLLCISMYAVSVYVLMHAADLHKTASGFPLVGS